LNNTPRMAALVCVVLSSLCLAAGFAAAGGWPGVVASLLAVAGWLAAQHRDGAWLGSLMLPASVLLAAVGVFVGASPFLMVLGGALALASWDLTQFCHLLAGQAPGPEFSRMVRRHFASLGLVMGAGLLAALASQVVAFQLPFLVIVALVAGLAFILERARRAFRL